MHKKLPYVKPEFGCSGVFQSWGKLTLPTAEVHFHVQRVGPAQFRALLADNVDRRLGDRHSPVVDQAGHERIVGAAGSRITAPQQGLGVVPYLPPQTYALS